MYDSFLPSSYKYSYEDTNIEIGRCNISVCNVQQSNACRGGSPTKKTKSQLCRNKYFPLFEENNLYKEIHLTGLTPLPFYIGTELRDNQKLHSPTEISRTKYASLG